MKPILAGIETEYGLTVEGRGAQDQVEESMALVRNYPGECFVGWDYRFESPRADIRGFTASRLQVDPEDAKFDADKDLPADRDLRSDRVLLNGARFYNDHGHPEYSTPECWGCRELAMHDKAGERAVSAAAMAHEESTGSRVRVYRNNTDYHGASYGTHESYLVPRSLGIDKLVAAVLPVLVARQVLTGAGKVGSERGASCKFQMSQRADFFEEIASVDTLYKRPVFNTRDEPHGDHAQWLRLHVICGDANMHVPTTARKVALVKMALHLAMSDGAPLWRLSDPVRAFAEVSRSIDGEGRIELEGGSWTTPRLILESYLDSLPTLLDGCDEPWAIELSEIGGECRQLLEQRFDDPEAFSRNVEWAAKMCLFESFCESVPQDMDEEEIRSLDLAYCLLDLDEGLYPALSAGGYTAGDPGPEEVALRENRVHEPTRAYARSLAVTKFREHLVGVSWGNLVFKFDDDYRGVQLDPGKTYPEDLEAIDDVRAFVERLEAIQNDPS